MGSFKCGAPVLAIDTEDDSRGAAVNTRGPLYSIQVAGERGERRYFRRKEDGGPVDVRAAELRESFFVWLRDQPRADLWACNATYDAINLGLLSRGVTATRASGGYTSWTHPSLGPHVLYDTRAIVPGGVAAMGESIELPKLEKDEHDPEYAMRDVDIVLAWILRFKRGLEEIDQGAELRATIGGTASALWRAMGGDVAPLPRELHHACRDAYRGGRVEVHRFGATGPAEVWDMRSAFPWAMRQGRFPVGAWEASREIEPEGIYDATVECKGAVGPLPVRCDGANVYPVGRFRGTWFGEELASVGVRVEKVHAGWRAREFENPFNAYVDLLWAARHGDERVPIVQAAKLLLNSLYGVIGHNGIVAGLATVTRKCKLEGRYVAPGVVAWEIDKGQSLGANPAWSGIITSRVRRRLLEAASAQVGRLVYMDTDSLFLTGHLGAPLGPLDQGDGLGQWRIQSTLDDMEMHAPKVYAMRHLGTWRYRAKGVSTKLNKASGMTYAEEFIKYARTRWRAPLSPIQAALTHGTAGAWAEVERSLRREYRARFVRADGRTDPWDATQLRAAQSSSPWNPDVEPVEAGEGPSRARTIDGKPRPRVRSASGSL